MRVLSWQNIVTVGSAIDMAVYAAIFSTDDGTIVPLSTLTPYESPARSREPKSITAKLSGGDRSWCETPSRVLFVVVGRTNEQTWHDTPASPCPGSHEILASPSPGLAIKKPLTADGRETAWDRVGRPCLRFWFVRGKLINLHTFYHFQYFNSDINLISTLLYYSFINYCHTYTGHHCGWRQNRF